MNTLETIQPLHEIILELFYFESKEKPCELTKKEILWKLKNPNISEYQIEEVLNWMVHHRKLNEILGKYTLDRFELIDLEEKFKAERPNKEKQTEPIFYTNYSTINNIQHTVKSKPIHIILQYILPTILLSYIVFIFFLINKLNDSCEVRNIPSNNTIEFKLSKLKTELPKKQHVLSDADIKTLFTTQHQDLIQANAKIDSLQKQIIKVQNNHNTTNEFINNKLFTIQSQVNNIVLHICIVLFGFIALFFTIKSYN